LRSPKHAFLFAQRRVAEIRALRVTIAPAGDADFVSGEVPATWTLADGRPKHFEISFAVLGR